MRSRSLALLGALLAVTGRVQAQAFDGGIPGGYACAGACGTSGPVGVLTLAPGGGTRFGYVTTNGGRGDPGDPGAPVNPADIFGVPEAWNGSVLTSAAFSATAGQTLSFAFNFLTTDGTSTYPDYAFVRLLGGATPTILFTAQTNPTAGGNTVPGFGLPTIAPGVTLTPGATPIIGGAPLASDAILGLMNGDCYGTGCGYTDWILASYAIADAGTYQLQFGVSNVADEFYDSALAFDFGAGIGGVPHAPSAVPEPATVALLGGGLLGLGVVARRRRRG
jgi:hypothetical protein